MDQYSFPAYLGFGKLNEQSIYYANDFQAADYYFLDEKVHEVKVFEDRVELHSSLNGRPGTLTCNRNLEKAVLYHFTCWQPSSDPLMEYFQRKICSLGNFYFYNIEDMKKGYRFAYYPAGHLFFVCLPVTDGNLPFIEKLLNDKQLRLNQAVKGFYETAFIVQYKNDETQNTKVHLLELLVPMAFLYDTVQYLVNNNMVLKEKLYRGLIYEASSRCKAAMSGFYGNEPDNWKHYYIALKRLL